MKNQLLALALIPAAFVSCVDDSYDLDNISSDYRIGLNEYLPIASSEVKMMDVLSEFKSDYITTDSEGLLTFVFDTVNRIQINPIDLIVNPETFTFDLNEVASEKINPVTKVIPARSKFYVPVKVKLEIDDENGKGRVDMIEVKEGNVIFDIEGINTDYITVQQLEIPGDSLKYLLSKDGKVNQKLDGKTLQFNDNELEVKCLMEAVKDFQLTSSNNTFTIKMKESHVTYSKIYGAFTSTTEQVENTSFCTNLYDNNIGDYNLEVKNPTMTITGVSNTGIPMEFTINNLVAKHKPSNSSKNDSVIASFSGGDENSASHSYSFNVESANSEYDSTVFRIPLSKTFGSLDKLFNFMPDSVSFSTAFRFNSVQDNQPVGIDHSYFLLDDTYLNLNVHTEVPFWIGDNSFISIVDTIGDIDLVEDITDYQDGSVNLDEAEVFIEFSNALPLEATVYADFCIADTMANGDVRLTKLENTKLNQVVKLPAAEVFNTNVINPKSSITKIKVTDDMIDDLKKINAINFRYRVNVPKGNVDGVCLKENSSLSAKVYAHLKANISNIDK